MNPWEVLFIALGWMAVITILLIAALVVLAVSIGAYKGAIKALKRSDN